MEITSWQRDTLLEGMYHFPTEENRDAHRHCADCAHSEPALPARKDDHRKRVRCAKLAAWLKHIGFKGKTEIIPAGAPGCHYWAKR